MSRWLAAFRGEAGITNLSRPENPEKGEIPQCPLNALKDNKEVAGVFGTVPPENSPKKPLVLGGGGFSGDLPEFSGGASPKTLAKNGPEISILGEVIDYSPFSGFSGAEDSRVPGPRPRQAAADDPQHQARIDGLRRAALRRPPSWTPASALPSPGAFCTCCAGQRWWCEREAPSGWCCVTCYPPVHLPAEAVRELRT